MNEFGTYLRQARANAGLSQRALAHACGIDISYISKLENGRLAHTPSARTLSVLAQALGANELEFFDAAGKLVGPLAAISGQPKALEVLRLATSRITSPEGWDALRRYVASDEFLVELQSAERGVPA
jgi:transcriptional regulator with XRE-family HTH domain